jgi:hypothetical protein
MRYMRHAHESGTQLSSATPTPVVAAEPMRAVSIEQVLEPATGGPEPARLTACCSTGRMWSDKPCRRGVCA